MGVLRLAAAWGRVALFACGLAAAAPALAQSPSLGAQRYATPVVAGEKACADPACHGTRFEFDTNLIRSAAAAESTQSALGRVTEMRFLDGRLTLLDLNDIAAYVARETGQPASFLPATGAAPVLLPASLGVDFGSVPIGGSRTLSLQITNAGRAALRLGSATTGNPAFALSHDCTPQVDIDGHCTLSLTFTPAAVGAATTQAVLASNDPASPTRIDLTANGSDVAVAVLQWVGNPVALTLPTTAVGRVSDPTVLSLRNVGTVAATLDGVAVAGGNAPAFPIAGDCRAGLVLAAGGACEVDVRFAPTEVGAPAALLQVQAQNAGLPPVVLLSGTATASSATGSTVAADTNLGGGGCTAGSRTSLFDPVWGLLLAGAVIVLLRRRVQERVRRRDDDDATH